MEEISYRRAEQSDIPEFVILRQRQLKEEGARQTCDLSGALADFFEKALQDESFVSWLAVCGGKIIATSGISFVQKPPYDQNITGKIGILSCMYTLPEYRRQGIAKRLLGLMVKEAEKYGCGDVQLTGSNMGVLLYENFGFRFNGNFMQYRIEG